MTAALRTAEERLAEIESRQAISDLLATYCEGVDRRDDALFGSIWHDDASYLIGAGRGDFHGLEEILRFPSVAAQAWSQTHHWTTNTVVRFSSPTSATGRSDCIAVCEKVGGGACFISATYVDAYEQREGTWKLARREVLRWFVSSPVDMTMTAPA